MATSAAVKADSTLPARANQVRFDTNEHANYFFFEKNGSLGTFLRFPVASENPQIDVAVTHILISDRNIFFKTKVRIGIL